MGSNTLTRRCVLIKSGQRSANRFKGRTLIHGEWGGKKGDAVVTNFHKGGGLLYNLCKVSFLWNRNYVIESFKCSEDSELKKS